MKNLFCLAAAALLLLASGCATRSAGEAAPASFQEIVLSASGKVFPAVVYITAVADNLQRGKAQSDIIFGSGVLISPDGELLSNCHVVDKAQKIRCQLNDGRAFTARVIGKDKDVDLALLKLELPEDHAPLPYAEIDYEDKLLEGDFVMAMGAPWGMNRSVSMGIVSCTNRYLGGRYGYSLWYQTDASISPGNSGGPLVNTEGKVVGINTLGVIYGGTMGFSIPAPTIRDVLPRLRAYGQVNWAWLGLQLQPLRDFVTDIYFDFPDGVIVAGSEPDSPAAQAGFQTNDRIVAVDGKPVTVATGEDMPGFRRSLGLLPFGVPVAFTVRRGDEETVITAAPIAKGEVEGKETSCPRWGFTAKAINRFNSPNLHYYQSEGVYVYGIANFGNARQSGLQRHDIIVSINRQPVNTLDDLTRVYEAAVKEVGGNPKAALVIRRNSRTLQLIMDFSNDYDKE